MRNPRIDAVRCASRKLVRELGMLDLQQSEAGKTPQHWHVLIEIGQEPGITVSKLAERLLLSVPATSRLVHSMQESGFIVVQSSFDKRQKSLNLSVKGQAELKKIDDFSDAKVQGAFASLTDLEQTAILSALEKYAKALEIARTFFQNIKILTLSTSRPLRKQIVSMVENIQKNEFHIPITADVNACVLRAEEEFYYNNSYNFWYAVEGSGTVVGCIGLKKIDAKNAELKKLFVEKPYRGKGVAQKLLQTLIKAAKKHGFTKLWLGTVGTLHAAKAFYTKCGFQPVEEKELPKGFERCHLDTHFFSATIHEMR